MCSYRGLMSTGATRASGGRPRKTDTFLGPDVIIAAAWSIVHEKGLGAVTMRELAKRLGCTPRALYRHVEHKRAVLELLADSALANLPVARQDLSWRESMTRLFLDFRQLLVDRPDVALIVAQQTVAGVNFRRHADRAIAVLMGAGFESYIAVEAVVSLAYYTLGASVPGTGQPLHDQWRHLEAEESLSEFPTLAQVGRLFANDQASLRFRRALERLLDGYERSL